MNRLTKLLIRAVDPSSKENERVMARDSFWKEAERQPQHSLLIMNANDFAVDNIREMSKLVSETLAENRRLIVEKGAIERKFLAFRMAVNLALMGRGRKTQLHEKISNLLDDEQYE